MSHIPVLLQEILASFRGIQHPPARYFDGTFGRGGHTRAILDLFPQISAVAMDRDRAAIAFGEKEFAKDIADGRLRLIHANYADFASFQLGEFDLMLLDLGVSSPQLDEAERGFSFYHDGPLDMRMDTTQAITASQFLQEASEDELVRVFKEYGEIFKPYRVVRAIIHDRKTKTFETTRELAGLIERVEGWRKKGFHPATQYFMALRLAVNSELEGVSSVLPDLIAGLKDQGRLAVITFHSLEDRIVKNIFKEHLDKGSLVNKKVIQATPEEIKINPRARSAKLRVFEKGFHGQKFKGKKYSKQLDQSS